MTRTGLLRATRRRKDREAVGCRHSADGQDVPPREEGLKLRALPAATR